MTWSEPRGAKGNRLELEPGISFHLAGLFLFFPPCLLSSDHATSQCNLEGAVGEERRKTWQDLHSGENTEFGQFQQATVLGQHETLVVQGGSDLRGEKSENSGYLNTPLLVLNYVADSAKSPSGKGCLGSPAALRTN